MTLSKKKDSVECRNIKLQYPPMSKVCWQTGAFASATITVCLDTHSLAVVTYLYFIQRQGE